MGFHYKDTDKRERPIFRNNHDSVGGSVAHKLSGRETQVDCRRLKTYQSSS